MIWREQRSSAVHLNKLPRPREKIFHPLTTRLPHHPQLKILWPVVQFLPVLMVNVLTFSKLSTQHLLHHHSVLKHVFTSDTQTTVPITVNPTACDVSGSSLTGVAVDTQTEIVHVTQSLSLSGPVAFSDRTIHKDSVLVWRVSYHTGFGGTHTAETTDIMQFRHEIGPVDWFEVYGAYLVTDQ